jgi:AraC-like DNA-binding protein
LRSKVYNSHRKSHVLIIGQRRLNMSTFRNSRQLKGHKHEKAREALISAHEANLTERFAVELRKLTRKRIRLLGAQPDLLDCILATVFRDLQSGKVRLVLTIRSYILAHLQRNLSLGGVARHVGMRRETLCRLFKRYTGMSFWHFIQKSRVDLAKKLLAKPELRIREVAERSGLGRHTTLNKVFKAVTGTTAKDYRCNLPGPR